jgi:hypothetical protein
MFTSYQTKKKGGREIYGKGGKQSQRVVTELEWHGTIIGTSQHANGRSNGSMCLPRVPGRDARF